MHHARDPSSITFVLDAAQRIYARGFTWTEVGLQVTSSNSHRLKKNYRNTREICQFAVPILDGLEIEDDGTFPDFSSCVRSGPKPIILKGKFGKQTEFAIEYILNNIDLSTQSVAFLHAKGYGYFDFLKSRLKAHSLNFVEIARASEWPQSDANIALSTMSSSKGLEFDHVFLLGLSNEVTMGKADADDANLVKLRRLLAMAITRAKTTVVVGYKPTEESHLVSFLDPDTFEEVNL
jgi:DNA helicase IV